MDRWRILVVNDGYEVLVAAGRFPEVAVPPNDRPIPHIRRELRRIWNLETACLAPLEFPASEEASPRYYLAELTEPPPSGFRWAATSSLGSLREACDREALSAFRASPAEESPFARPGGLREITRWVECAAAPRGFTLEGRFEQYQAASRFSLIRFEASPRALWFKAVGAPNEREFPLTVALGVRIPFHVPTLVASRPDWNAWLAEESPGRTLDETRSPQGWEKAARALAELQIASLPHAQSLRAQGAHRWESFFLPAGVARFLEAVRELDGAPGPQLDAELPELAGRLEALSIPAALGHLDLNAGNVVVSRERCVFLDWAEAYVGFPLATFAYLLEGFRNAFGRESRRADALVDSYLGPWRTILPRGPLGEAWELAPALALYAYTARCLAGIEPQHARAPRFKSYLEALLRRLGRELDRCRTEVRS